MNVLYECVGVPYEYKSVDLAKGEQFSPGKRGIYNMHLSCMVRMKG